MIVFARIAVWPLLLAVTLLMAAMALVVVWPVSALMERALPGDTYRGVGREFANEWAGGLLDVLTLRVYRGEDKLI